MRSLAQAPMPAAPSSAGESNESDRPRLDIATVLGIALEANPTLRAALLDAVGSRADARVAATARTPTLTASSTGQYTEAIGGTANGVNRTRGMSIQSSAGLAFATTVGTSINISVGSTTQWRQAGLTPGVTTIVTIGPTHSANATVSATQPLLRGAGRDSVLAEQRAAEARAISAEASAEVAASQLVRDVLAAYWELWYADRALSVQTQAVDLARQQAELARQQRSLGTLAPADVLQFVTAEASLREQVASAQASRRARVVELARLLSVGVADADSLAIDPEAPGAVEIPLLTALVDKLRTSSPTIHQLEADVRAAQAMATSARNGARARLDATGSAGVAGLWMEDSYQGLALPGGRPAIVASVGLSLELPVSSDRRRAQRASANADLDAAEARLQASIAQLETSLASQLATLQSASARSELTLETARVSDELAAAERSRLTIGATTPQVLLSAQQTARESVLRHDRALVDAVVAAVDLEHGVGALLERFDVSMDAGVVR